MYSNAADWCLDANKICSLVSLVKARSRTILLNLWVQLRCFNCEIHVCRCSWPLAKIQCNFLHRQEVWNNCLEDCVSTPFWRQSVCKWTTHSLLSFSSLAIVSIDSQDKMTLWRCKDNIVPALCNSSSIQNVMVVQSQQSTGRYSLSSTEQGSLILTNFAALFLSTKVQT